MESGKMLGDQRRKLVVMNKCAISFSGCGETRWHLDALLRKSRRHLAQRRIFAANGRHVGDGDFLEPQDQWLGHGFPPAWAWRQASCRLDRLFFGATIVGTEVRVIFREVVRLGKECYRRCRIWWVQYF